MARGATRRPFGIDRSAVATLGRDHRTQSHQTVDALNPPCVLHII
jgi:hypothetical protein